MMEEINKIMLGENDYSENYEESAVNEQFDANDKGFNVNDNDISGKGNEKNFGSSHSLKGGAENEAVAVIRLMMEGSDEEYVNYFKDKGISCEEAMRGKEKLVEKLRSSLRQADLKEIREKYPFVSVSEIEKLPNFDKFSKFRRQQLSASESFEASNSQFIMDNLKKRQTGNHSHFKTLSSTSTGQGFYPIPKDEVSVWESAFPKDSFYELTKRYNKTIRRKENV